MLMSDIRMADARPPDSQPKDAVQLQLGSGILQKIIDASEKGLCTMLRLETAGGVSRSSISIRVNACLWRYTSSLHAPVEA